ncbi:hypothetical protein BDV96DRAFT_603199 [Lophiotrema nucula]|uniref:Uncharacterized protein n=1 Tax=Lophiotrema nucula TaxID=690887 RepID=A0A6A5YY88_9PLEO|nr:hypothetical protein BDV96DRAFT_603199 [Lophiotrema nucula]
MQRAIGLFVLPLLVPLTEALAITTNTNRAIGNIEVFLASDQNVGVFSVGPEVLGEDDFKFQITISPEAPSEGGGSQWGLVQNLLHSTRLSSYQDGSFINGRPTHEPPILDGGDDIIPFFDNEAFGTLNDGGSLQLTISDGPNIETVQSLYLSSQGPSGPTATLSSFQVDETFRISLVQKQGDGSFSPFFQCEWTYSYTLNQLTNGAIIQATSTTCTQGNEVDVPIVQGPVATEAAFRQYNPDSNSAFNEVRFVSRENPTPTPIPRPRSPEPEVPEPRSSITFTA